MRKAFITSTLTVAVTLFGAPAFADETHSSATPASSAPASAAPATGAEDSGKKIIVGGDILFTLPLGDLADATGPLVGASVRAGYYLMPQFEGFVRVGYQLGLSKTTGKVKTSINNIPVYLGGRYFFMEPGTGLYGQVEVGANLLESTVDLGGASLSSSTTRFGFNAGAGYVISKELPLNIGAQLNYLNLLGTEAGEKSAIGATVQVGYAARF